MHPLLLLAPGSKATPPAGRHTIISGGKEPTLILRLWESLGMWPRIVLIGIAAIAVLSLVVWALRQLSRGRWRRLVGGIAGLSGACVLGFSLWAVRLPTPRGTYYVLWHQFV